VVDLPGAVEIRFEGRLERLQRARGVGLNAEMAGERGTDRGGASFRVDLERAIRRVLSR